MDLTTKGDRAIVETAADFSSVSILSSHNFTQSGNRITYTGATSCNFVCSLSFTSVVSSVAAFYFQFHDVSGSIGNKGEIRQVYNGTGNESVSTTFYHEFNTNDFLELIFINTTDTSNIVISTLNWSITPLLY